MQDISYVHYFLTALVVSAMTLSLLSSRRDVNRAGSLLMPSGPQLVAKAPAVVGARKEPAKTVKLVSDPKSSKTSAKLPIARLIELLDTQPKFVLDQLVNFYNADITESDPNLLRGYLDSLAEAPTARNFPPNNATAIHDMEQMNQSLFSTIKQAASDSASSHDHLALYGDTSVFSESVNELMMLTDNDTGYLDNGTGFYPVERVNFLLKHGYGPDQSFGSTQVHTIIDPSPALMRMRNPNSPSVSMPSQSQPVDDLILHQCTDGVRGLLRDVYQHGCARFCLLQGEGHFVSGALVMQGKDMHLIAIDSMDNKQQGRFSASGLMKALLDRVKISIPDSRIHARYYALTHNGRSVNLQQDGVSCGPWSTEILSRLTPDRCKAIVSDSRALDKLILDVARPANAAAWQAEDSCLRGAEYRHRQYQYIRDFQDRLQSELDQALNSQLKKFK